jgi:hypothetical protein
VEVEAFVMANASAPKIKAGGDLDGGWALALDLRRR